MLNIRGLLFILLTSSLLLSACRDPIDPKEAHVDNFTQALQAYHNQENRAICATMVLVNAFPVEIEKKSQHQDELDALALAGLLLKEEDTFITYPMFGSGYEVTGWRYSLTPLGNQYLTVKKIGMEGRREAICFGDNHVDKITHFTEPKTYRGYTTTQVTYTTSVKDVPEWTQQAEVKLAFPNIQERLNNHLQEAELVLVDEGWVHAKLVRY